MKKKKRSLRLNSKNKKWMKNYLLNTFGDGSTVACRRCWVVLDYETLTIDRYPIPGAFGGKYNVGNVRPLCSPCNHLDGRLLSEFLGRR